MSYPYGLITELRETIDQLRADLSALKADQGEAVAWRYDMATWKSTEGWRGFARAFEDFAPHQWEIDDGKVKDVVPLYTAPPASADAVSVPRELLERATNFGEAREMVRALDELRALLAQSQGVKP